MRRLFLPLLTGFALLVWTGAIPVSARSELFGTRVQALWASLYDDPASGYDGAWAIEASPDGAKVYVTGESGSGLGLRDYATIAYDSSTGAQLWAARYDGPDHLSDSALAMKLSPDGSSLFVTGDSDGASTATDYATVAYNPATGGQLWASRYDGPAHGPDAAYAIGVSPDASRVYVTGSSSAGPSDDYATISYDAKTGAQLWVKRFDGPGKGDDSAFALGVGPEGSRLYVGGASAPTQSGNYDYVTVAYDAISGSQLWVARYGGPDHDVDLLTALKVGPDGSSIYVTGYSTSRITNRDFATVAYDAATGIERWTARWDGPASGEDDPTSLAVSPDGSKVYVAGHDWSGLARDDLATVAYDAKDGMETWARQYDGPSQGDDHAEAVGVSPDGSRVYVTGFSDGTSLADYMTIAYDSLTAHTVWMARAGGKSYDYGSALAVSPTGGRVFVTGKYFVAPRTHRYDYGTLAYPG